MGALHRRHAGNAAASTSSRSSMPPTTSPARPTARSRSAGIRWRCAAATARPMRRSPRSCEKIGRRKLIMPTYEALVQTDAGLALAKAVFAKAKPGYHPITTGSVQKLIDEAKPQARRAGGRAGSTGRAAPAQDAKPAVDGDAIAAGAGAGAARALTRCRPGRPSLIVAALVAAAFFVALGIRGCGAIPMRWCAPSSRASGSRSGCARRVVDGRRPCAGSMPNARRDAADAPTVVMLHGYTGSKENWYRVAQRLRGRYRLVIPDLPGLGRKPAHRRAGPWLRGAGGARRRLHPRRLRRPGRAARAFDGRRHRRGAWRRANPGWSRGSACSTRRACVSPTTRSASTCSPAAIRSAVGDPASLRHYFDIRVPRPPRAAADAVAGRAHPHRATPRRRAISSNPCSTTSAAARSSSCPATKPPNPPARVAAVGRARPGDRPERDGPLRRADAAGA